MKLKKLLASILAICMVLSTMSFSVFATDEPVATSEEGMQIPVVEDVNTEAATYWSCNADTSWYKETDEDGKKIEEFTLTTAEELAGLAKLVDEADENSAYAVYDEEEKCYSAFKGVTIKLGASIDLYAEIDGERVCFNPIGSYRFDKAFSGTFDGQGNTISNLYQNTWALDTGYYYTDLGLGLFGMVNDAKIRDVKIDGADISGESALCGTIAATAYGDCTFENITISNTNVSDYQYYAGGIVGWASGNHQYINCDVEATTTIGSQWGDFGNASGGIIGGTSESAVISMKNCDVACRIDAVNDVVSAYQWYAYRNCGMLIGRTGHTATDEAVTNAAAPNLTCENVTVTYGDWANYTYCEFAGTGYPYVRVQAGTSVDAYSNVRYGHPTDASGKLVVDDDHVHNDGEDHHIIIAFNQLYGGPAEHRYCTYGVATHEGVTIIDNAKEEREEKLVAELLVASSTFSDENVELVSVGKFETLQAAIDAITSEGDYVIKVLKDISDNVTIKQAKGVNITIDGDGKTYTGTITVDGKNRPAGAETVTIENVNFVAENKSQTSIDIPKGTNAHNITVDGCTFTGSDKTQYGITIRNAYNIVVKNTTGTKLYDLVYGNRAVTGFSAENITVTDSTNGIWLSYVNSTATLTGLDIDVDAAGVGFINNAAGTITIEDSDIKAEAPVVLSMKNATNQLALTIAEENGIFESTDPDGDAVSATGNVDKLNAAIYGGAYSSDVTAYLADGYIISTNEHGYYIPNEDNSGSNEGTTTPVATSVKASLVPVEGNPNKYDVVLTANEGAEIHRFLSAELNIKFKDEDTTPLSIKSVVGNADYGIEVIDPAYNESGVWGFHLDDRAIEVTGNKLTIATVELMGYGKGELVIYMHKNNKVEAIQSVDNNKVKKYITDNTEDDILKIDQTINHVELKVPTKDLTIEITFPNPIEDQVAAYQDMTVTVEGKDIETITKELGLGGDVSLVKSADGKVVQYVITLDDALTENNSYNITVTGAGYRTAEYRVTMTEDKTVYFWNDAVKGEAIPFEKDGVLKAKTSFLAGDIAEDNIIDKYDLAAVVSYFGRYGLTSSEDTYKYAKYDLNRDGKIDSEDIAYVLASFGY